MWEYMCSDFSLINTLKTQTHANMAVSPQRDSDCGNQVPLTCCPFKCRPGFPLKGLEMKIIHILKIFHKTLTFKFPFTQSYNYLSPVTFSSSCPFAGSTLPPLLPPRPHNEDNIYSSSISLTLYAMMRLWSCSSAGGSVPTPHTHTRLAVNQTLT